MEDVQKIPNRPARIPQRRGVDIEFQDLTYSVPQGRKGSKIILRNVNGKFAAGQLTAILGPSGAGKSTLLNILAGYKCREATGSILVNGEPRNIKSFRDMSRYIMQQDLIQPLLSVQETMMLAANLKLCKSTTLDEKKKTVAEILELLRLSSARVTRTNLLSGGERKRLSIALELLNNPLVLFLDEPTTGLDDLSSAQCVSLLKQLAQRGRTVICSVHTPSAKLFSEFDNVYVISAGQCTYQGYGPDVIHYLKDFGFNCPNYYNPADFVIEICSGEYGDFHDRLVAAIDNGKNLYVDSKHTMSECASTSNSPPTFYFETEPPKHIKSSNWDQFRLLLMRMWTQMWRDKRYLAFKIILHIIVGILIGNLYIGIGEDGSKTIFTFGFYFNCIIFFMYIPMMPILLSFPMEVQYLKREHFNKWYNLGAYFCALSVATLPLQIFLGCMYLTIIYFFSNQPMELYRFLCFIGICCLTGTVSESFGLLVSSTFNTVNSVFVGPVMMVPFMVFAAYGFGEGYSSIPVWIRVLMHFSYLRYAFEALVVVMLSGRRLKCPETEEFCYFTDLDDFIEIMAMSNSALWLDIVALIAFLFIVRGASFYLLRQRLAPNKTFLALQYIGKFVKSKFSQEK